jgi:dihydrofolate synthase/folylpolyglutamate synthase
MSKQNEGHSKRLTNLNEWLCYLETIHNTEIDLGLSRINQVAKRLQIDFSFARVITVAGTNGKGTTCAFLENALLNERVITKSDNTCLNKVAVYSSPHIVHFNERLRINKRNVDDQSLISAFEQIEIARKEISLSYYEYTTLAAFLILMHVKPDVIILEVGLGGRLDATNIIDADVAVITSIDIDHQAFLGNDRDAIGFEKAGIMRANQHIIIGDPNAPKSVIDHAKTVNEAVELESQPQSKVKRRGKNFFVESNDVLIDKNEKSWQWKCVQINKNDNKEEFSLNHLINTFIPRDNVATALMVLKQLDVSLTSIKVNDLINQTQVAGRTELFKATELESSNLLLRCDVMLDVGHHPPAGRSLAGRLAPSKNHGQYKRIIAVVAMLVDKDITNTLAPFNGIVDEWFIGPLAVPRASTSEQMKKELSCFTNSINCFDNITQAFRMANLKAESTDLILVFGSFFTVAEIRQLLI